MYISIILTIGEYKMNVTIFISDRDKEIIKKAKAEANKKGSGLGKFLLDLYKTKQQKQEKSNE